MADHGASHSGHGGYGADRRIAARSIASLEHTSSDEIAREIEDRSARVDWFKVYWVTGAILAFLVLLSAGGVAALLLTAILTGAGFKIHRWNEDRRRARLLYDIDDPVAMERFALASAVGEALAYSANVWHIYRAVTTSDARRNAGATTLISRTPTQCSRGTFLLVETNLDTWSIPAGPQQLLFLPDRLLLLENGRVASLAYEHLTAAAIDTRFVEDGPTPRDGEVVATTWRFVCKDGSPDLRFNNNHQLPVLRYGEVTIASQHGVRIVFQISRADAAQHVAHALNTLSAAARGALQASLPASLPAVAPAAGAPRRPAPTLVDAPAPQASPIPPVPPYAPPPGALPAYQPPPAPSVLPRAATPSPSAARPPEPSPPALAQPALLRVQRSSPAAERQAPRVGVWIPPGNSTVVAGYELPGGMIYVGETLPAVCEFRGTEPALINPRLPVDRARPNRSGEGMGYWPSYAEISPRDRAAYLEWLAAGRSAPDTGIGYVFLFLYGLERRALADAKRSALTVAERDAIFAEIQRLLGVYGGNNSFRGYATDLLHALLIGSEDRVYARLEPPTAAIGNEYPLLLRLGLGQLARDRQPIPAKWALSWALCAPAIRLPMPAKRCPEELRELFAIRYGQAFGRGMILEPGGEEVVIHLRPASATFGGEVVLRAPAVPDVAARMEWSGKLSDLVEQCVGDLDPFSRWIGRNPEKRGSILAAGLLPTELLATYQGEEVSVLCRVIESSLEGKEVALAPAESVFQGKQSKADIMSLAQLLQKKGYGIEPDIRFGGEPPRAEGKVVVFRLPEGAPVAASTHYRSVALLLHLAVAVAAADGDVSEAEQKRIEEQLESIAELLPADRARLAAHLRWLAHERPGLSKVKKRIQSLSAGQRGSVADFIIAMAAADGRIDPGEVKMLTKLFPMLGIESSDVYRRIHALAGANASPATEPVLMQAPRAAQGYKIPPVAPAPSEAIVLDMASVQSKLAETSAGAALLDSIFAEDDPSLSGSANDGRSAEPTGQASAPPSGPSIRGLNAEHSSFLHRLRERACWSRAEVELVAAELGLLTDGALETVNEAAFEACGAPVWSGDDPIEIEIDVMKELCA